MRTNIEKTTVKDIAYLINSACLRAPGNSPLEKLADQLCSSDRYKVYLEDEAGLLIGVIQAKQIAMKILELSHEQSDTEDMLPAIAFALNAQIGSELAEVAITIDGETQLKTVLELMEQNYIREIAVVNEAGCLVGTLEAKNILSHYLQAKAKSNL